MDKDLYIGKEKVKDYIVHENTNLVGVLFENGKNEDYTNEQWANIKSEEPYEDGLIMIKKHEKMMQRMIKEMVDSRVTLGERGWILERVDESIHKNYSDAVSKAFGVPFPEKILLAQIDMVLKE
jgi:protoporphyrinogen oxidase